MSIFSKGTAIKMADSVDSIDDGELRRQLGIFTGREIGPITNTTRSLYKKKLKDFLSQSNHRSTTNSSQQQNRTTTGTTRLRASPAACPAANGLSNHPTRPDVVKRIEKGFSSDESDDKETPSSSFVLSSRPYESFSSSSKNLIRPGLHSFTTTTTTASFTSSASSTTTITTSTNFKNAKNDFLDKGTESRDGLLNGTSTLYKSSEKKQERGDFSKFQGLSTEKSSQQLEAVVDNKSQNISFFVLALGVLFFAVVAYIYVYNGYNTIVFTDPRDSFILCPKHSSGEDLCVPRKDLTMIQDLVSSIIINARSALGDYNCGYREESLLARSEVEEMVERISDIDPNVIFKIFLTNVHWEMQIYNGDREITTDIEAEDVQFIATDISRLSVVCRARRLATSVFCGATFVAMIFVVCLLSRSLYKSLQESRAYELNAVTETMEKVINVLKRRSEAWEYDPSACQAWMPVTSLRDTIIPLEERKLQRKMWQKVINQLKDKESRLAFKIDIIAGEEREMVRWVPFSSNNHQNGGTKTWQGSAIGGDCQKKSPLKIYPPLTSCLKIRNMFDSTVEFGNAWTNVVQDAILEKVGPNHGIVHIVVDEESKDGCVYVRCKDENSAGRAFSELHCWWFDGRLVTVKYLRKERFVERFPDTAGRTTPLRPSNPACLSLSVPAHSSILENS